MQPWDWLEASQYACTSVHCERGLARKHASLSRERATTCDQLFGHSLTEGSAPKYIYIIVNCTIFLYISFHQGTVCDSEWGQYSKIASPLWSASSLINDHKTSNLKVFVFTASEGSCILALVCLSMKTSLFNEAKVHNSGLHRSPSRVSGLSRSCVCLIA